MGHETTGEAKHELRSPAHVVGKREVNAGPDLAVESQPFLPLLLHDRELQKCAEHWALNLIPLFRSPAALPCPFHYCYLHLLSFQYLPHGLSAERILLGTVRVVLFHSVQPVVVAPIFPLLLLLLESQTSYWSPWPSP